LLGRSATIRAQRFDGFVSELVDTELPGLISRVRIIVWGINYAPEETGIGPFNTGMCEWLAAKGHSVEMVTTFTYYPAWRKAPRDRGRLFRTDLINGIRVRRNWHYVPGRVSALKRMLHEASFIGTSFLRLFFSKRPDVLVVVSPPLPLGFAARILCTLWRRSYLFHVQDLQPDAAVSLGMLKPGAFTQILYWLETVAYRGATVVSGISEGMLRAFASKKVAREKLILFPNWIGGLPKARDAAIVLQAKAGFCAKHKLDPSNPLAVYSGNIGEKQGLLGVLDAAATPQGRLITWVIAGDGAGKAALEARKARDSLANVALLPLQPLKDFEQMLLAADACLVTQQRGSGQFFFPSKLLTLLTHGCPIVAVADESSELATAVQDASAGELVVPGDGDGLALAVARVASADSAQRAARAENGRRWVSQFERERVLGEFEIRLASIARRS
jgi:colanic acid biosynthesis glycosyl transferase WcaI